MQSVILTKELARQVTPRAGRVVLHVPRIEQYYKLAGLKGEPLTAEEINADPSKYRLFLTAHGALILPESCRDHSITDTHQRGKVLKVGYGEFWDEGKLYPGVTESDIQVGDWVIFRPLLMELNASIILTDVRRIDARIEA